ncbi:hypothetical protein M427DRAFT_226296 [Gonapodya prolifera JEL478]|uniref:FAD/NAD(P)-binding domain-containing protein n=1 Tax=Gonapodya prolifera (strain JEL478) TaxID=1344416 RepID=A0A139ANG6_GONPJ|nr:hypothetical protein M427DRAFT_226296 [Gonapodya prolifera JEL478]|eukprot:KXS18301.1 hypothetical protein M427DRAFT_226296 [Gonapodya prolifera JEL478]
MRLCRLNVFYAITLDCVSLARYRCYLGLTNVPWGLVIKLKPALSAFKRFTAHPGSRIHTALQRKSNMLFGSKSFKDGQTRRIVVVGGGYAGTTASQKLAGALKNFPVEITMIERRDTFHHSIGSPRAIVEPGFEKQLFVPYDNVAKDLPNLKVKTNTFIQSVEATHLVTATSEVMPFDYLVLATGANNREIAKFPTKPKAASAKAVYQKIQENVKSAKSFVVVGGGAVGVGGRRRALDRLPQQARHAYSRRKETP